MYEHLTLFRMSGAMARHATARQAVIAENLAHADTPGYREKDVAAFADTFEDAPRTARLTRTRPGHRIGGAELYGLRSREVESPAVELNGNSVSVITEMMKSARTRQEHDTALTIYRSTMKVLRATVSSR